MPEDADRAAGLIGPNAILQLLPVIEQFKGSKRSEELLIKAGIFEIPDGLSMIPEGAAARLHKQLRLEEPEFAALLSEAAGRKTADYILANRIPKPANILLKGLPKHVSAMMLSRAIERHSWTFVGSGHLRVPDPWTFELQNNPLIKGEYSETCLCHWHVGVFTRLYQKLVSKRCECIETRCGAQNADRVCRFCLH